MKSIPICAAERIAKEYDYDQIIIVGRKIGEQGGEHVTTYGRTKENCVVAAAIGEFLKYKIMGWRPPNKKPKPVKDLKVLLDKET